MGARRDGFVVKIRQGTSDVPVGVGFVVGDKHIVTCAHVVNVALGRQKGTSDRPGDEARIQVEFVLLGDAEGAPLRNCRVTAWDPPPGPGRPGRDIAGLVLVGGDTLPVGAGPARLVDPRNGLAESTEVSVFGYPGTPRARPTAPGAAVSCGAPSAAAWSSSTRPVSPRCAPSPATAVRPRSCRTAGGTR